MSALFYRRPQVGPYKLWPMAVGRLAILEEKKNPIVVGAEAGQDVPSFAMLEIIMAAALDEDDLIDRSLLSESEWNRSVKSFSMGITNEMLLDFNEIFAAEMKRIEAAKVEPIEEQKKSPGKKARVKKKATRRRG